jgi:hypothetical protein
VLGAADRRGDGGDVANSPPGCIGMSSQPNRRKRDPPWLLARMYVSYDRRHLSAQDGAKRWMRTRE